MRGIGAGAIKTPAQGNAAIAQDKDEIHRMEAAAGDLSAAHQKILSGRELTIADFARRTSIVMLLIVIVTFGVATVVTVLVSRGITRPVKTMATHLHEMAQGSGDLTKRIAINSRDEVSEMAKSFNLFFQKLEGIISEVRPSTHRIRAPPPQLP